MTILYVFLTTVIVVVSGLEFFLRKSYTIKARAPERSPAEVGLFFREVRIPVRENVALAGWYLPVTDGRPRAGIILVHGWGRTRERLLPYLHALYDKGYDLLAFDARGHGESDRDGVPSMVKFAHDILASGEYLRQQRGSSLPLYLIGLSIGGAASIYAAALDHRFQKVITVGAFANPAEIMKREFAQRRIPYFPLGWLVLLYVQLRIGKRFRQIAPINNISRARARFLLVHGQEDQVVPFQDALRLSRQGQQGQIRLLAYPHRGHSDCHEEADFFPQLLKFLQESP